MIADSKKMEPDVFSEQRQMPAQRETYFDCLRLMAAFAVMALHVADSPMGPYTYKGIIMGEIGRAHV